MPAVFNPPPNWPQPPPGWQPPSNWRPDPAWGPAPAGWRLWVDEPAGGAAATRRENEKTRIFISYRRSDAQSQANGLYDGLSHRIEDAQIFMDIDSIPIGVDFEQHIRREIEICDLVLVLIGDDWLACRPGSQTRRIDEPGDFVRLEVEKALEAPRATVVPVLVEGADMPSATELPESIRPLARLNAVELSDKRWTSDVGNLAAALQEISRSSRQEAKGEYRTRSASGPTPRSAYPAYEAPSTPRPEAGHSHQPRPQPQPQPSTRPPAAGRAAYPPRPVSGFPPPPTSTLSRLHQDGWLVTLLPVLTCGLAAFAPPLRAALMRKGNSKFQARMFIAAGVLQGLVILGLVLLGSAPEEGGSGTPTGVASDVGGSLWLLSTLIAVVIGIVWRRPPQALPGTALEDARRQARERYRTLIADDPAMARRINVGRPDLPRDYDDGGLLDLNHLDGDVLVTHGHLSPEEARRVASARESIGAFANLTHVVSYADLSPDTATRLRELAVFL